jgi:hypothetical protein
MTRCVTKRRIKQAKGELMRKPRMQAWNGWRSWASLEASGSAALQMATVRDRRQNE